MVGESNVAQPLATVSGTVVHGDKVGRTLGFPTANLELEKVDGELTPGVYAAICKLQGRSYRGLAYYGPRLIFGEKKDSFEVFLYEFSREVYGETITAELYMYIREPLPFTSLENLRQQLEADSAQVRASLDRLTIC